MATHSFGATLTWNSQVVAELTNVGGLKMTIDKREKTVHKTSNRFKTYGAGLVEAGDIAVSGYFLYSDTNGQIAMIADAKAGTERTYLITLPAATGATLTGTGFISDISTGEMDLEGNIPFEATITPTDEATFAVAASAGASALTIATATIYPTWAIGTFSYVATTTGATFTVTPTAAAGTITVTANGVTQTVLTGQASSAISAGSANTVTPVVVTVTETNKAPKTYTINVTRTA